MECLHWDLGLALAILHSYTQRSAARHYQRQINWLIAIYASQWNCSDEALLNYFRNTGQVNLVREYK